MDREQGERDDSVAEGWVEPVPLGGAPHLEPLAPETMTPLKKSVTSIRSPADAGAAATL